MSYCRLVKQSPLKMMDFHYSGSFMSEMFPEARKVRIDGIWYTKEATSKTAKVLKELGLKIS